MIIDKRVPASLQPTGITDDELLRYRGQWTVEEPTVLKGLEGDLGLVAKTAAAHHVSSLSLTS